MAQFEFVPFAEVTSLLEQYQIPLPPAKLVQTADEAVHAFEILNAPVALKIISQVESHKSDRGLLSLGISTPDDVFRHANSLLEKAVNIHSEGLLVQEMAPKGVELIAGLINDPTFGMMLMFGAGGVLVELLGEATLRLAPISQDEARWLITHHYSIYRLLQGYRGQPPADVDALALLLENLSHLGFDHALDIESLDINPVIVSPEGVHVVDFRMQRKDSI